MKLALRLVLVAAISLAAASAADAQKSWVGKTVIVKKDDIKIANTGDDGKQVIGGQLNGIAYCVLGDKNGLLQVNDGRGKVGWFPKADAVELDEAAAYYTERIRQNAKDRDAYLKRAFVRQFKGELDSAIKDYGELIRLNPCANAYIGRGNAWRRKRDYEKAIADYSEAIRLDPKNESAYFNRGNAWGKKKDFDMALADFEEAIRLDPEFVDAHASRAAAWSDKKDYDKAIVSYNQVIRLDPTYVSAYLWRADTWRKKEKYDKAIADYTEAIRLDPTMISAYWWRAKTWLDKKDYAKAIKDFNEVIRLDPESPYAYNMRAWIWATCPDAKTRDGKKALESGERAIEIDPKSANNMDTLAAAYAETGDFAQAVRWQEKALADPQFKNNKDARRRLELYRDKKPYRQE